VHFQRLFVAPRAWGSGLARELMTLAKQRMERDDFLVARLFTPAAQARARRFYEREGWTGGEAWDDPEFGMPIVRYTREL
jgi:GNAT superfamily N-acetyltransferase